MGELRGVQVFRKGAWKGNQPEARDYGDADLDALVANFHALRDTITPRLALGHIEEGSPAYGIVSDLRREADVLVADFADMPDEITGAIRDGKYRDVSIGFHPSWESTAWEKNHQTGVKGPALLHVALLGAQQPAVSGLKGLPRVFSEEDAKSVVAITFAARGKKGKLRAGGSHPRIAPVTMGEPNKDTKPAASAEEVAALQKKLDEQAAQLATFAAQDSARQAENKAHQDEIAALKRKNAESEARARKADAERFVAQFASAECLKLVTPGEQAAARRLHEAFAALPEQTVTFSEDGKEQTHTLLADFEAMIAARPDAKGLLKPVSQRTEVPTSGVTMAEALKTIAAERKLDTSKPTWKRDATILLCSDETYKATYAHLVEPIGPTTH